MAVPTHEEIRSVPKVLLHDHLDGGVRPQTVIDLARQTGYDALPTQDPQKLERHLMRGANRRNLDLYLETFAHTVGVMQTPQALSRVARECAEDLHADGVVLAEIRFAPELHTERGMTQDEVVAAVVAGFKEATAHLPIRIGVLLTAMRTAAHSLEIAELAVRWRDDIVVGFDIAGEEAGNPPTRHLDAFHCIQRNNFHFTIHAGRVSACLLFGRRFSIAGLSGWGTACASLTTSTPSQTGVSSWGDWRPMCATAVCRWSFAQRPMSTRVRRNP